MVSDRFVHVVDLVLVQGRQRVQMIVLQFGRVAAVLWSDGDLLFDCRSVASRVLWAWSVTGWLSWSSLVVRQRLHLSSWIVRWLVLVRSTRSAVVVGFWLVFACFVDEK